MNWRDLMVGALISVTVAIVAGIFVWWLTREPRAEPQFEQLRYSIAEVASFSPGEARLGIVTIKVSNIGNKAAHDVRGIFLLPEGAEIKAKQISMSSGPAGLYSEGTTDSRTLNLSLPTLAPTESLTVSLLVQGTGALKASGGLRSADSVGTEGDTVVLASPPKSWFGLLWSFRPLLVSVVAAIATAFVFRQSFRSLAPGIFSSVNNTAFLCLQQKMFLQARSMLMRKMKGHGSEPIEMANLALATGLGGDLDEAERLFKIAEWWSTTNHAKAIIAYNRATLFVASNEDAAAKAKLKEAVRLSPRAIAQYFQLSAYFDDASRRDPAFAEIVSQK
ncbi:MULTISPECIES: hypothetical protein [unclassified Bradyrhizobium]|uniref:hypothetical protein n=1 Tax=unclassified Bradyrhizobium TaxID=2631580 RepID=UPI002916C8F8|nr:MULTISPECIES: hypothetical protein [unclassified Bradyrhizobium]